MEYRPYYLAREWVRAGHHVRIIASAFSHVRSISPTLNKQNSLDEIIDGIHYTWYKTPHYNGNGAGRVKNMASFVFRLFREGKTIAKTFKPDVVIASSTYPMDIWPAHRIAKFSNAKLIFEVHDLWPLSPMELGGMSKWHPFIMLVQRAEDYAYRHSSGVVSMLPKVHSYMESRGVALHKLHVVPNGIDPAEWQNDNVAELGASVRTKIVEFKKQGLQIVGYAGTHGVANALNTLIDAAQLLKDEKIVFVLFGGGPDKKKLQYRVEREKLENIIFFDPVNKNQIPVLLSYFDIAYIGWHKQPLYRFGIAPNKLMDYMMAKRNILHSVDAGNDPVTDAGCGLTVPPENPNAIAQGLRQLLAIDETEREMMGVRGREFVLTNHTYTVLAASFLKILQNA